VRLLFVGDVVGKPGRRILTQSLAGLRIEEQLDLVVVNAENSASGSGLTPANYRELIDAGIDCITMGDHVYRRREIFKTMRSEARIVKPANYPPQSPGKPYTVITTRGNVRVAIFCLLGRVFMPPVDCPFTAAERVLSELPDDVSVIVVDFHAEATSDMQVMGRLLDGRVSAVLGTHTHVPTADEHIMPGGTAFQCDVGMTGPMDSIIGRRVDRVLETVRTFRPKHFEVATGDPRLQGSIIDIDASTGRATAIKRIEVDQAKADQMTELARNTP
jgi:metallophosphoesterase (TIGR00282 family)